MDWAAIPHVVELLGVEDVELLVHSFDVIRARQRERQEQEID